MPSKQLRQEVLAHARHTVVKLGTQLLTKEDGTLDRRYLSRMARQVSHLRDRGIQVTIVSSGAIGAGCTELGLNR